MSAFEPGAVSPTDQLRPELAAGESLVWVDRPHPKLSMLRQGAAPLGVAVLWVGFLAFWESTAYTAWRRGEGSLFFVLFGLGFMLIGLNGMFGAQLRALSRLRRAVYGITDRRVLFLYAGPRGRQIRSLDLDQLGNINKTVRNDGTGTITFGPKGSSLAEFFSTGNMRVAWRGTRNETRDLAVVPVTGFFDIADVDRVARILEEQRAKLR